MSSTNQLEIFNKTVYVCKLITEQTQICINYQELLTISDRINGSQLERVQNNHFVGILEMPGLQKSMKPQPKREKSTLKDLLKVTLFVFP